VARHGGRRATSVATRDLCMRRASHAIPCTVQSPFLPATSPSQGSSGDWIQGYLVAEGGGFRVGQQFGSLICTAIPSC
jgi:hypothetical protein